MICVLGGDPYENLANAIILQAVMDYRHALRKLRKSSEDYQAKDRIAEVERFFRSRWYSLLTDVDGEMILERLRKEVQHDKRRR